MGWKTSSASHHLASLATLLVCASNGALAQTGRESLQCSTNISVPPSLISEGLSELLTNIPMTCTGGPVSGAGTSNVNLLLDTGVANTSTTGMPLLTITHDECSHLGQSIFCPPGVAPGSNSSFFDASGNIVFPGPVTVPPSDIFPFSGPTQIFGTVNGNTATWTGVPVDVKAKGRRQFRFTNVRANALQLTGSSPNSNFPVFGTFTSSSSDLNLTFPTSLSPGSNKLLLGVAMPSSSTSGSAFCESPLVITPGVTPFAVPRQVAVGGAFYDAIVTFSGPSAGTLTTLDLYAYTTSTPGSCQGHSIFNPVTGALDLQNVFYEGQDFWGQANQSSGTRFSILRYGSGTMPPR